MPLELLAGPFVEFAFMRRALIAVLALALGAAPLGVLLTLRRLSLVGDALSHAVLPGVALGFMFFGLSLTALSIGGVLAGMLVVMVAALVSRHARIAEDASLAALYLVALALGVMLISLQGSQIDLLHILFGNVLGVDRDGLLLVASVASATLLLLAAMYRGLLIDSFDPAFLAAGKGGNSGFQQLFLMLVVVNLVAAFQTLGTLMAVGLMMLPAISARLWHDTLAAQLVHSSCQAMAAGVAGLLLSYHAALPSGPSIIVCAGLLYGGSLLLSPHGALATLRRART